MSDYIKREDAIDAMERVSDGICEQQAIDALCELPSADVVEVVRCKNCKWWTGIECANRDIDVVNDEEYCSYGERTTDEHK